MGINILFKKLYTNIKIGLFYTAAILIVKNFLIQTSITINNIRVNAFMIAVFNFSIVILFSIIEAFLTVKRNKGHHFSSDYYREIPRSYSPSMVSVLFDLSLQYNKDVMADLLYLENRGYLRLPSHKEDQILVQTKEQDFTIEESHLSLLMKEIEKGISLKALLDAYKNGTFLRSYKTAVYEDLIALGLLEKEKRVPLYPIFISFGLFLLVALSFFFFGDVDLFLPLKLLASFMTSFIFFLDIWFTVVIMVVLFYLTRIVAMKNYKRTKTGKEDVSIWFAYYDFLRDFSRMKERTIEERVLWNLHYAYALSFGMSRKTIDKFSLEEENFLIR